MRTVAELRAAIEAAIALQRAMHEEAGEADLSPEQQARWEEIDTELAELRLALAEAEQAEARAERVRAARRSLPPLPGATRERAQSDFELRYGNPMATPPGAYRDAVMALMEDRSDHLSTREQDAFATLVGKVARSRYKPMEAYAARTWLQSLTVRATDDYRDAWTAYVSGSAQILTPEQARAIQVGTNTAGGYLVPTNLDPTVILTNDGGRDKIRPQVAARGGVKTLLPGFGRTWQGITSAGVEGSWDAESVAVSDDSPTFDKDSVTMEMARAWATASFQSLMAIAGVEEELYRLFRDTYERMEGTVHAVGTGSGQPTGLVTALEAVTTSCLQVTTSSSIGIVDVDNLYLQVPERWRDAGSFALSTVFASAIKRLGTSLGVQYSGSILDDFPEAIKGGKRFIVSDFMPSACRTTATDPLVVFGDFGGYILVDRPGSMAVEFVQNVFDGTTATPVAERGWLCWWEHGADVLVPEGLALLQQKTSA